MMRPIYTWILFGLCLALATAAMGWVSWTALRLDHAQGQAQRQAQQEEDIRLALWRLDSTLWPLIAQESGRPYFWYRALYPAEREYNRVFEEIASNQGLPQSGPFPEILLPSPLLAFDSPEILVHFQIEPDGVLSSPQVPRRDLDRLAKSGYINPERIRKAEGHLRELERHLRRDTLLASLPVPQTQPAPQPAPQYVAGPVAQMPGNTIPSTGWQMLSNASDNTIGNPGSPANLALQQDLNQPAAQQQDLEQRPRVKGMSQQAMLAEQQRKSTREYNLRAQYSQVAQQVNTFSGSNNDMNFNGLITSMAGPGATPAVSEGILKPTWEGGLLILARRVSANGGQYIQGCLLNWPVIRQSLLQGVSDLLPGAALEPVTTTVAAERSTHLLAALPVRLEPGPMPDDPAPASSPVRVSLIIAWGCMVLAAAAVGALLMGAVTLSERRGAFVSAVTHELRTPLTTLRMYTEMLAEGMVRDEGKRRSYLTTLRAEADRLGHLVENVLAYSRIERGRARGHITIIPVRELIDRVRQRLAERAEQAGMRLVVEPVDVEDRSVRADPSAVEQILFNLVDNACKYAASAADRSIHLDTAGRNGQALIRVRDHGPGITLQDGRRLFRPFCKSARDAANSAPGVGLGLALSRRLAREMGGDLCLDEKLEGGAGFTLMLPVV